MTIFKVILILIAIILLIALLKIIKPYTIKYDHTLTLSGGNGSGKTLTGVKTATILLRKARLSWWFSNLKYFIKNKNIKNFNKKAKKYNESHEEKKQLKKYFKIDPKPELYSTIPVCFKPHIWSSKKKREYCCKIKLAHLTCLQPIAQNSIILLDELPQMVNQYNWDIEVIKNNFSEFATFHRHYYNSTIIITSQAVAEIVAQIRRKANISTWCFNFRRGIWPLHKIYYKMSCCDLMINDAVSTTASTLVEENTKTFYGFFPPKDTYDSRCYRYRIENAYYNIPKKEDRFENIYTNEIIRFETNKISPLDDETTDEQKEKMAISLKLKPKGTQTELNKIIEIEKTESRKFTNETRS